jgi:thiamine-phosphate pyrophosphorylase
MTTPDLRVYLVTDPSFGPDLRRVVVPAVEGGVTCVQVRDKQASPEALASQVTRLQAALAGSGVPVLANDHVVAGADGVHGGRSDAHPTTLRSRAGRDAVVGWSVEDLDQLADHDALAASSYVAASPVHATPTKQDTAPALGLDGVRALAARLDGRLPLVGIGGLHAGNATEAVLAGLDGVAVVRAVGSAPDPCGAARRLRAVVDEALTTRRGGAA